MKRRDKIKAKMESTGACLLKHKLLTLGFAWDNDVGTKDPTQPPLSFFADGLRVLHGLPAVLDPIDRVVKNQPMADWTNCRPPFDGMYLESFCDDIRIATIILTGPKLDDGFRISTVLGMGLHLDQCDDPKARPKLLAFCRLYLNDQGEAIKQQTGLLFPNAIDQKTEANVSLSYAYTVTRSIQIMTANNVGLHEVVDPSARNPRTPRYVREHLMKQRHHVLVVKDPRTGRVVYEPRPDGQQGIMPLHVARGHWAHYGEQYGKGRLFGKLAGRFWVPDHEKGKAANGQITKSYLIDSTERRAS